MRSVLESVSSRYWSSASEPSSIAFAVRSSASAASTSASSSDATRFQSRRSLMYRRSFAGSCNSTPAGNTSSPGKATSSSEYCAGEVETRVWDIDTNLIGQDNLFSESGGERIVALSCPYLNVRERDLYVEVAELFRLDIVLGGNVTQNVLRCHFAGDIGHSAKQAVGKLGGVPAGSHSQ